ncbi:MAG TPA: ATP-binding protein [Gemmatimonadaceae bacterium]|nr:ATP-binding protein [Gemmatimonadaceae bacterium]
MKARPDVPSIGAAASPLLQELGDVLELGVLTLDRSLVVRGCNRWLAMAIGVADTELIGRSIFDIFDGLAGSPAEQAFRRALNGVTTVWSQQFHGFLLPLPAPPGHESFERMQQSARIAPVMREGEVDGVLALVQDVTERVAREQALRRALQAAEVASQAKSDFLAAMSHELRTPLGAIVGYMELLLGDMVGALEPLQRSYLGRVRAAARHLITIIEEILSFSRLEAGKQPIYLEDADAAELARDAKELFEPQATEKGLALVLDLPSTVVPLRTDKTKLRQILINLLGNAVKFTDTGRVSLELNAVNDRVVFRVRDTGSGITATDAARIFDPFTQVDQSLKRVKGGTGLGLPVSQRLSRLLEGDLTVDSVVGEGTTFTLSLPVVISARSGALPESPRATPIAGAPAGS